MRVPGETGSILGVENLGDAIGALDPRIGILGSKELFFGLDSGVFTAGDRERVTPGGNLRLISSRLPLRFPTLLVMQFLVLAVSSLTRLILALSFTIAIFLSPLTLTPFKISCFLPASFAWPFNLDTTVEPIGLSNL